jgi:flagellar basal body-associated protein FliL
MADESAPGAKGEGGGSVLKKWGPLAAIVLVAQVVLAWVLITKFQDKIGGGPKQAEQELFPKEAVVEHKSGGEKKSGEMPYYYSSDSLKKIATNPAGTNATRFVQFDVTLGLADKTGKPAVEAATGEEGKPAAPEWLGKVEENLGKIKAIIVEVMRGKTVDQFDSEVLPEVQDEIRRKLNQQVFDRVFVNPPDAEEKEKILEMRVVEVIFTTFVIQ